ncbi:MAG: phosphonate ABC transporter, permease protein PhnE [Anaerolinea sp.]|nr:phosphonate ABC transporter, permease protein PhnE [Anaerolinea sp.]
MNNLSQIKRLFIKTLAIAGLVWLYSVSSRITQLDFVRLVRDASKAQDFVAAFLDPDMLTRDHETTTIEIAFPIPCGSAAQVAPPTSGPRLVTSVPCAAAKEKFTLEGFALAPDSEISIRWRFPDERVMTVARATTDARGSFSIEIEAKQIASSVENTASRIEVDTLVPVGGLKPSQALKDVTENMFVTIFMALLSTTLATIVAAPLSFLAAGNITGRGPVGTTVYYLTRSFFNITRSYDPLVMATVFAFWLGYGPFAGTLALTVVTIASLGKLFSEAVESIDPGPIEALQASGANRFQTVMYAVVPQIVPDFVSFIVYHWDINVRISTIIGFVGGGGIGYYLSEQINSMVGYHRAATAIWAIVLVVWVLDFLSAEVRKRLT